MSLETVSKIPADLPNAAITGTMLVQVLDWDLQRFAGRIVQCAVPSPIRIRT